MLSKNRLTALLAWILCAGCSRAQSQHDLTETKPLLWSCNFESNHWAEDWKLQDGIRYGEKNLSVVDDPDKKFGKVLRVFYPKGSWSPGVTEEAGIAVGGAGFLGTLGIKSRDALHLRYYVRFEPDFDFVKGGKLPGLFGGTGNTGGHVPNGRDGFSTRFVWRGDGLGEVYAYLPTSLHYGTDLGRGNWKFKPGVWHCIEQRIELNTPGSEDGRVQVWFDGKHVLDQKGLRFRDVPELKIDGLMFSTFFGGADSSWATPKPTYTYFDHFAVSDHEIGPLKNYGPVN